MNVGSRSLGLYVLVATLFGLAACGGSVPAPPIAAKSNEGALAHVVIKFPNPGKHNKAGKHTRYLSQDTYLITIQLTAVNNGPVPSGYSTSIAIFYQNPNGPCGYNATAQDYECNPAWVLPRGNDTFLVSAYDPDGYTLLGQNAFTLSVSGPSVIIPLSLWGVAASMQIYDTVPGFLYDPRDPLHRVTLLDAATSATYRIGASAVDAAGYVIAGQGTPAIATQLSSTSSYALATPAPGSVASTLTKLNGTPYEEVTLTVSAQYPSSGPTPLPTTCPTPGCGATKFEIAAGPPLVTQDYGYAGQKYTVPVLDLFGAPSIADALAHKTLVPTLPATIQLSNSAQQLVFDRSGNLFAFEGVSQVIDAIPSATVLGALGGTKVSYIGTNGFALGGYLATSNNESQMAFDPTGNLLVPDGNSYVEIFNPASVTKALAPRSLTTPVVASGKLITSYVFGYGGVGGLAIDGAGNVFVGMTNGFGVSTYPAAAVQEAVDGATNVNWAGGGLSSCYVAMAIVIRNNALYCAGNSQNAVFVYSSAAMHTAVIGGAANPTGSLRTGAGPKALAFDRDGNLWVSDAGHVVVFSAASVESALDGSQDVPMSGDLYGNYPGKLTFDSVGNLYVEATHTITPNGGIFVYSAATLAKAVAGGTNVAADGTLGAGTGAFAFYP